MCLVAAGCVLGQLRIGAHHSGSEYDRTTIEIQGQLLEVASQNAT